MDTLENIQTSPCTGELHTISATHSKSIANISKKDAALQRRFQPVTVNEPTINEALQILRVIKESLEAHHHVTALWIPLLWQRQN